MDMEGQLELPKLLQLLADMSKKVKILADYTIAQWWGWTGSAVRTGNMVSRKRSFSHIWEKTFTNLTAQQEGGIWKAITPG